MAGRETNDAERANVLKLLHSILISTKNGVALERLNREYRSVVGENIPYRNLGYGTLNDFIENSRTFRIVYDIDGVPHVRAIANEETSHIQELVQMQNSKKKPKPKPQRRPFNTQARWQPPTPSGYYPDSVSGFRHGFRPHQQNGYRMLMRSNQDQSRPPPSGGSGRFPVRGGKISGSGHSPNSRLRAPQNGPQYHGGGPPRQYQQQLSNSRPMSQRLGPPNGTSAPPPQRPINSIKILEDYFMQMNLGQLDFKTSSMVGKSSKKGSGPKKYFATVRVNNQSFQTYPNEYNSEQEAKEAVAKLACEGIGLLSNSHSPGNLVPTTPPPSTGCESLDVLIERISKLVGSRVNGVWSTRIEIEYQKAYGQSLPENWTESVDKFQSGDGVVKRIHLERPTAELCIIMPIINVDQKPEVPKSPTSANSSQEVVESKSLHQPPPVSTASLPPVFCQPRTGTANIPPGQGGDQKLPELILPKDNVWDVYVTHVFSTVEVWVRLIGDEYSTKFEDLVTDMELHFYDAEKFPQVTSPIIGRLYAAVEDTEWHRVEVVSIKGIEVTCYFIDHGSEHRVLNVTALREIDPKFLSLAPQAKRVRLAGLEELANSSTALAELSEYALLKSLVGIVHSRENNDQDISLVLVNTSGSDDLNINQTLLEKLRPSTPGGTTSPFQISPGLQSEIASPASSEMELMNIDLASLKPLIPVDLSNEDQYFDVKVTLAASPSNFTVQPYKDASELVRLNVSMSDFYSDSTKHFQFTEEILERDIWFAALHTNGQWYRAKITDRVDACTVAVKYVDYGESSLVPIENLQPLWPQFRNLPMQAINATLFDIIAVDGDWSVDDTVWFARRVVNNEFVTIIKNQTIDLDGSIRIGVSLIDTSHPKTDIYIEKELVKSGRAVDLCI